MSHSRQLAIAAAGLVAVAGAVVAAPTDRASDDLVKAVVEGRWNAAGEVFRKLAHPSAMDQYFAGFAEMRLNRPLLAEERLKAAKAGGFAATGGWPTVDALLARVDVFKALAPPSWRPASGTLRVDSAIDVHAGPATTWTAPVLDAVPSFAAVGRRIFGEDLPPVAFHLFSDRPTFDRFYVALFGVEISSWWQDGTGGSNAVVICATDRFGRTSRPAGDPETVGCVLHEFSHAWCAGYLMKRYDRDWLSRKIRTPWFDEGLADFVASLRESAFVERRASWLTTKAKSARSPSFEEIATYKGFYAGDVELNYWLSAVFVAELLGPRDAAPAKIRAILDDVGKTGDVEKSVATATGKDLRTEFVRVVQRFW